MASSKTFMLLLCVVVGAAAVSAVGIACPTEADPEMVGGYTMVGKTEAESLNEFAVQAMDEAFATSNKTSLQGCDADTYGLVVTGACKQVVAGTNYIVEFESLIDCEDSARSVKGAAKVFMPLPAENLAPELVAYQLAYEL